MTCIPDSKARDSEFRKENFPRSGFHGQSFPHSRIQIPKHGATKTSTEQTLQEASNSKPVVLNSIIKLGRNHAMK